MVPEMERVRSRSVKVRRSPYFELTDEELEGLPRTEESKGDEHLSRVYLPDPTDILMHPLKKNKNRRHLRVSSQQRQ